MCGKCGEDLEQWNVAPYKRIRFCPSCGAELTVARSGALFHKVTPDEIADRIRGNLLDMFAERDGMDTNAEDLGVFAWSAENVDGVALYSSRDADRFCARHDQWVEAAIDYLGDVIGDRGHWLKEWDACSDRFLVSAFIAATEHYVFDQLGVDRCEGVLTEKRIMEIKRLIRETPYDGAF
jgi:hypothetical protein